MSENIDILRRKWERELASKDERIKALKISFKKSSRKANSKILKEQQSKFDEKLKLKNAEISRQKDKIAALEKSLEEQYDNLNEDSLNTRFVIFKNKYRGI